MQKDLSFYSLFSKLLNGKPTAGNCKCPAGKTQTCVHAAALLITLTEITPQACISMVQAYARWKAVFCRRLGFWKVISS